MLSLTECGEEILAKENWQRICWGEEKIEKPEKIRERKNRKILYLTLLKQHRAFIYHSNNGRSVHQSFAPKAGGPLKICSPMHKFTWPKNKIQTIDFKERRQ